MVELSMGNQKLHRNCLGTPETKKFVRAITFIFKHLFPRVGSFPRPIGHMLHGYLESSGRKNVLRKLLRIPGSQAQGGNFLCVNCVCLLLKLWVKCTRCECLLPVKHFYSTCLLFFRRFKITLDAEQPMLKEKRMIPSVRGGIKGFEHF